MGVREIVCDGLLLVLQVAEINTENCGTVDFIIVLTMTIITIIIELHNLMIHAVTPTIFISCHFLQQTLLLKFLSNLSV